MLRIKKTRRSLLYLAGLVLLIALASAGCSRGPGEAEGGKPQTYGHDGYMGLSNSNPNLPSNPNYYSYSNDTKFMKEKLGELKGIEHIDFRFQDPDIYVNLRLSKELSEEQALRLTEEAQAMLQYNMPRYLIHVKRS